MPLPKSKQTVHVISILSSFYTVCMSPESPSFIILSLCFAKLNCYRVFCSGFRRYSISPPSQLILAFTIPYRYLALYISSITIRTYIFIQFQMLRPTLIILVSRDNSTSPQPSERGPNTTVYFGFACIFDIPIFWRGSAACLSKIQPSSIRMRRRRLFYPMALPPPLLPSPLSPACPHKYLIIEALFE